MNEMSLVDSGLRNPPQESEKESYSSTTSENNQLNSFAVCASLQFG